MMLLDVNDKCVKIMNWLDDDVVVGPALVCLLVLVVGVVLVVVSGQFLYGPESEFTGRILYIAVNVAPG